MTALLPAIRGYTVAFSMRPGSAVAKIKEIVRLPIQAWLPIAKVAFALD
jgi:hypothetical protein